VGPGVQLQHMADYFAGANVTIPHGECPMVCIGGHVQTGGYGHLLRSFGLALDYVAEFEIVLANETIRTIVKPAANDQGPDANLFRAVLGGGPNSFGILTQIKFAVLQQLRCYGCVQPFPLYTPYTFKVVMGHVQEWASKPTEKPDDLFVTVVSNDVTDGLEGVLHGHPSAILVEMLGKDESCQAKMKWVVDDCCKSRASPYNKLDRPGEVTLQNLSALSNSFVRRGRGTINGREFNYPFIKRVQLFSRVPPPEFFDKFCILVDKLADTGLIKSGPLYLCMQLQCGGGAYAKAGSTFSSIGHRQAVLCIVFDVFYEPDPAGANKVKAKNFHDQMGALYAEYAKEDLRCLWGSFGNTKMNEVSQCYYDEGMYPKLQSIKKLWDETDVFHTDFTVQLPA